MNVISKESRVTKEKLEQHNFPSLEESLKIFFSLKLQNKEQKICVMSF
jgi:hypothetical protein